MGDLTLHFSRHEFACKGQDCCGHSAPISRTLVYLLEDLWERLDDATLNENPRVVVSSGFRCLTHNRKIGSKDTSQHPLGLAADIFPPDGFTPLSVARIAISIPGLAAGGIGVYSTFVHFDIRGKVARWGWRSVI